MSNECCSGCACSGTGKKCLCSNIIIPLGAGHSLEDADVVTFEVVTGAKYDYKGKAEKFFEWMSDNVAGGFMDALSKEFD